MRTRKLLFTQGIYYLATGLWSIADSRSFQKVTGPKTEVWLVKTFGALVSAVGATLLLSSAKKQTSSEARFLSISSAAALATAETIYSFKGRISPVYLLDAAVEFLFLIKTEKQKAIQGRSSH